MKRWTSARVARALATDDPGGGRFTGVGTDTRTLPDGALFVALRGERFDAHDFLDEARARGARAAVVRHGTPAVDGLVLFEVDDTLAALGRLAWDRRREISGPVVAVTGTNGKTATKEMLAAALGTCWRVHATSGNLNNLVGVPLTILGSPEDAQALVVEAGASVPGEIARLRAVIDPTVGVVTNVSLGHTEGFGSIEGVLAEKLSLLDGVALAVVGTEPRALRDRAATLAGRVRSAGTAADADVRPDGVSADERGYGVLTFKGQRVTLPVVGRHQAENAMLALAVADELGVAPAGAVRALATVRLPAGRCEVVEYGSRRILNDTYNANPASVRAVLATAQALRRDRPLVIVLGTMLELGAAAAAEHARVADEVVALEPTLVGVVGQFVPAFERQAARLGDRLITAPDPDTLGARLAARLTGGELVVVKASRGVRLERAIPHLLRERN
jgi:UDP-N-acetylmuramoyl-tripeptide--D-alanyl-D-alanine ligase